MSFAIAARLARRELRGGLRGFRIFLACLALGVAAIAGVGLVRAAIQAGLEREGASLLGGDAEIEFTYRFARDEELDWMATKATEISAIVDFRSLAVATVDGVEERGLTQVRAVDSAYPLLGRVTLDPDMPLDQALAGNGTLPGGVMETALAGRLGLAPGDTFRLGTQEFILSAILLRYPDNASGSFGLGPRSIVLTDDLAQSGLITEGTLFNTNYRLDLPEGADLQSLEDEAEVLFRDDGLRWRDARRGAGGTAEFVDRLGSFLVLIGLSGLAVGGVGVSSAVRAYLASKTNVIATLKTLGATRRIIFLTYFIQIGVLTLIGIALGLLIGIGLPLLFAPLIQSSLPIPASFGLYPRPMIEAGLYGLLAAMIFTLWPLARTEEIKAAAIFRDAFSSGRALPKWPYLLVTALLIAALVGSAIYFSGTAELTLWTTGGIAFALGILALAGLGARALARRTTRFARGRPALRLALGSIGARGGDATSVVLSLGLGLAVLASVGQIDGNLRRLLTGALPDIAPSYFFVDIQPDQIDGFRDRLTTDPLVERVDTAPMLRGIITQINGMPARDFTDHWVIRGDRGITYSEALPDNVEMTAGTWWEPGYDGPPLVSFSQEEASEMGLSLGDTVTVNILGREITATVSSFRQVEFDSAGIGFVMSMNPAALAGAPHSWISTVYCAPEAESAILRDLAGAYPNITAIRIKDAVEQVSRVVSGISAATRYGAAATLLTGFLVLIGAAAAGEGARRYESAVLKTLGASRARILASFALRAALLGAAAGIVALTAGISGGWAVTTFVMDTTYAVEWPSAISIVLGGILATLIASLIFALRPLAARPAQVLRARE